MARGAPESSEPRDTLARALDGLRRELRGRLEEAGAIAGEGVSSDDLFELFNRLRKAANSFGMRDRSVEVDEFGLDPAAVERSRALLDFLCERWWRVEVHGLDQLDPEEPALLVANHSGLLPYDGLVLAHVIERAIGRRPRFLLADWLVTLPFAQPRLARLGGVRACRENAQRLLRAGHSVIAFPEGAKGATKVFAERYRVQRFGRGGVVRVALEERVPLVPVSVVGAEEAHPILFKLRTLARGVGLPFVPVTPTFPWLGPAGLLPLPSKWRLRIGTPLPTEGVGVESVDDEVLISRMTEELRQRIQSMVDEDRRARAGVFS